MRTTRRATLQLGLGGLAGALPPAAATGASPFDLAPDWRANWVLHKDPDLGAEVTQLANGIDLRAAPYAYDDEAVYERSDVALWSGARWTGDFRAAFDFTRLDDVTRTTGRGIGAMLYFHVAGQGDDEHPESIARWPSREAREETYVRYGRGHRVTWSNFNTRNPRNSHEMRLRTFAFTTSYPVQVGEDSPAEFPFVRDRTYRLVLERRGRTFNVAVDGEAFGWDDPAIGRYGEGYFGIRHQAGRHARYENFTIIQP